MEITPSFEDFKRLARRHNVIPLSTETVVDRVTPVSVYERLARDEDYSFLLESVEGGERFGRYSLVGQRPHAVLTCRGRTMTYREGAAKRTWRTDNPLQDLKKMFNDLSVAERPGLPRFSGGAVGYWDYDTARFFERLPDGKVDALQCPTGIFQFSGEVVVFDRIAQTAHIIANVFIPAGRTRSLEALYKAGVASIKRQHAQIHAPIAKSRPMRRGRTSPPKPLMSKGAYISAVQKAQEHIRAGEIIQVVLSQRWMLKPAVSSFQVYRALRIVNPSPYMYFLHFPELDLVGSSPELLVRKERSHAETRPIAGTRRRGESRQEDELLAQQLIQDPKERAEHLMLVDLGRNDLGRVCRPGTVAVPELMTIENYSHVMHIVSSVTGELSPQASAFDLFQACFPAGTLSGAPKIRAMEIIDELEPVRRGPYAGAAGYFSYNGNMDMAITIRTLLFTKGKAYMQAGAGIVADSIPEREYRECEQKAAALFAAVQKAQELP